MSPRNALALDIRVYAYGVLVASGKTIDISEHGVLLHIQDDYSADELDPGKHLDVQLAVFAWQESERWLPVKVVRKCGAGIAAHFIGVGRASG